MIHWLLQYGYQLSAFVLYVVELCLLSFNVRLLFFLNKLLLKTRFRVLKLGEGVYIHISLYVIDRSRGVDSVNCCSRGRFAGSCHDNSVLFRLCNTVCFYRATSRVNLRMQRS